MILGKEFGNKKFNVLYKLNEMQLQYRKEKYVSITQQELADVCHLSKAKCNEYVQWLIANGLVVNYDNRKNKYQITDKGKSILKIMNKEF
jgi:predicted transcriptional regulator